MCALSLLDTGTVPDPNRRQLSHAALAGYKSWKWGLDARVEGGVAETGSSGSGVERGVSDLHSLVFSTCLPCLSLQHSQEMRPSLRRRQEIISAGASKKSSFFSFNPTPMPAGSEGYQRGRETLEIDLSQPGGQTILHAASADRTSTSLVSAFPIYSTVHFPETYYYYYLCTTTTTTILLLLLLIRIISI